MECLPMIPKGRFKYSFVFVCFCLNSIFTAAVDAEAVSAQKTINQAVRSEGDTITSIFNDTEPDPLTPFNFDDLIKDWYQVEVTEKSGMFNPVFLPFNYVCKAGDNDPKQSLTFPCLLSFKFDFVPDNYCSRHPAFIYRKKPIWNVKSNQTTKIANYIHYWEGTHAIGGTVFQNNSGYMGRLLVFDKNGKEVLKQNFKKPIPYFTLMGKMVEAWMEYRNQSVSKGLYNELIRPMTDNMECVKLYGTSFDMQWRTENEWAVYDKILKKDPDFAEVRFWYANQKSWATGQHRKLQIEKGKALKSHLVMPALFEFDFKNCSDQSIVSAFLEAFDYAETICSGHNVVSSVKLDIKGRELSINELDSLLEVASKYPCSNHFLNRLAGRYDSRGYYEKSIPLLLSSIKSGYLKGTGGLDWEWFMLATAFNNLGYPDETIYCGREALKDCSDLRKPYIYWHLGKAYQEKKRFLLAAECFDQREKLKNDATGAFYSHLCAYQGGYTSLLQDLQKNSQLGAPRESVIHARELLGQGQYNTALDCLARIESGIKSGRYDPQFDAEIVRSDIYCLAGNFEQAKKHAIYAWYMSPRSRQVAYLLKKSTIKDTINLAHYAKVGLFICPNDPCWKAILDSTNGSVLKDTPESILNYYNKIKNEFDNTPKKEKFAFWSRFYPFEIEYICMNMLSSCDREMHDKVLSFYKNYKYSIQNISKEQKNHTRLFMLRLKQIGVGT